MPVETLVGKGREAIGLIADPGSFAENRIGAEDFDPQLGPAAVVGTARVEGRELTLGANISGVITSAIVAGVFVATIHLIA